jgi:uncharacterized protein (DUF2267 family)
MAQAKDLSGYYELVQQKGKLRSRDHAKRWSSAVLNSLGFALDRGTKQKLAAALPPDLEQPLTRMFWLLHFRNASLSTEAFLKQVSRRSGNTDTHFARYPTLAVFAALKELVNPELNDHIAEALPPEVSQLWRQA